MAVCLICSFVLADSSALACCAIQSAACTMLTTEMIALRTTPRRCKCALAPTRYHCDSAKVLSLVWTTSGSCNQKGAMYRRAGWNSGNSRPNAQTLHSTASLSVQSRPCYIRRCCAPICISSGPRLCLLISRFCSAA